MNQWSTKDKSAVWHPNISQWQKALNITITRAEGASIFDTDGNRYLDMCASEGVTLHGHCDPRIAEAIREQVLSFSQTIYQGFTHQPSVELAEALLQLLPTHQAKVLFSTDHNSSIEIALKIALQYDLNRHQPSHTFLVFEDCFHGNFLASILPKFLQVIPGNFSNSAYKIKTIPLPDSENIARILKKIETTHQESPITAFVFEPLVLFQGGMKMYKAEFLEKLLFRCQQLGITTIADESYTAFGRLGSMFACDYIETQPDIFCLSNGLTGGVLPLGVTTCSSKIYHLFLKKDAQNTFYHTQAYPANALACTAANASLNIFKQPNYIDEIVRIIFKHQAFAAYLKDEKKVNNVRQTGTLLAFDIAVDTSGIKEPISDYLISTAIRNGVILGRINNTIYLAPPYCITNSELDYAYTVLHQILKIL